LEGSASAVTAAGVAVILLFPSFDEEDVFEQPCSNSKRIRKNAIVFF
jgi:hypothetical protein